MKSIVLFIAIFIVAGAAFASPDWCSLTKDQRLFCLSTYGNGVYPKYQTVCPPPSATKSCPGEKKDDWIDGKAISRNCRGSTTWVQGDAAQVLYDGLSKVVDNGAGKIIPTLACFKPDNIVGYYRCTFTVDEWGNTSWQHNCHEP